MDAILLKKSGAKGNKVNIEDTIPSMLKLQTYALAIFTVIPFFQDALESNFLYLMKYVSFVLFLVALFISNKKIKTTKKNSVFVSLVAGFSILSLMFIGNLNMAAFSTTFLYVLISLLLLVSNEFLFRNISTGKYSEILWVFAKVLFILVVLTSFYQWVYSPSTSFYVSTMGRKRFIGMFNNPNELARFCLMNLMVCVRLIHFEKFNNNKFLYINLISSMLIIYLTNSRTALLCALLVLVGLVISKSFLKAKKFMLLITFIFLSFSLVALVIFMAQNIITLDQINDLLSGRIDTWTEFFQGKNLNSILLGSGNVRTGLASDVVVVNGYIEIVQNIGLIGLIMWLSYIFSLFMRKKNSNEKMKDINLIVSAIITLSFALYYYMEGGLVSIGNLASIYFWLELSQGTKKLKKCKS